MNEKRALSVVLVNYKVYRYLHLALQSLEQSIAYMDRRLATEGSVPEQWSLGELRLPASGSTNVEVWVVDNASQDGSEPLIKAAFPWVHWIQSSENLGFAKANNLALSQASGRYLLIQNPDTVLSELTLWKCWLAMESDPKVGALGVRMVDGQGQFLRESKRGLPTPEAAFFKLTGLANWFPRHPRLAAYHLGHLNPESDHDVSILAGAFMWVRSSVAQEIGLLDERYFMYGEDIDWSYRILRAGYRNRYLGTNPIVHFKGESTRKESMRYVRMFYGAMMEFASRYYGSSKSFWLHMMLRIGIAGRASIAVFRRWSVWAFHPLLDWAGFMALMHSLTLYWENHVKVNAGLDYPAEFKQIVLPAYVSIWVAAAWFNGAYDKPYRYHRVIRGMLTGTLAIGFVYAFLPVEWRFSRGLIWAGAGACLAFSLVFKGLARIFLQVEMRNEERNSRGIVLGIGSKQGMRLAANLYKGMPATEWIGYVGESSSKLPYEDEAIGQVDDLLSIVKAFRPEEVVLDSRRFSFELLLSNLQLMSGLVRNFKFLPIGMDALIGNGDIIVQSGLQDLILVDHDDYQYRRSQRRINLLLGTVIFIIQPFFYFRLKPPYRDFSIPWKLWGGQLDWIGSKKLSSKPFLFDIGAIEGTKRPYNEQALKVWVKFFATGNLRSGFFWYAMGKIPLIMKD